MKKIVCSVFFLLSLLRLPAQTITAAEYFFNSDPGAGMAMPLPVGTPASSVTFSANVPTTNLSSGFHTLGIRVKDANGTWGPFEGRTVYVSQPEDNVSPVTAAEYFIDSDPGTGKGIALGVGTPGNVTNFSAVIPTATLQPGFHHLVIRTRNAAGQWGFFESRGFYIHAQPAVAQPVTAAEYFIDNDPGPGKATAASIGGSGNAVTFTALIPTASLSPGFHTLAIRAKNAAGVWGIVETGGFYVQPVATNMGPIVAAEYFLDADPGIGNGSSLSITTPGNTVSQNFLINIPASIPNGQHLLAIRVKDATGIWSLFALQEITVDGFPLPLNWLSFTAKRVASKIALQWKTANEINTSHFDVERSRNGIDFTKIGELSAKGLTENSYDFDDNSPLNGLNYYRLKQVDKDGKWQYATVAKAYFGDAAAGTLKLFPQPVRTSLNIIFDGNGKDAFIQVYDAAGKRVLNKRKPNTMPLSISTHELAGGMYWIVVSDGTTVQKGQFVKQQ